MSSTGYCVTWCGKPTPPTNIITNDTILTQYSINQGLKGGSLARNPRLQYKDNYIGFMMAGLSDLRNPNTSVMNSGKGVCHIQYF